MLAAAFSALVATSLVVWAFLEDRFGSIGIVALSLAAIFAVPPIVVGVAAVRRWASRAGPPPLVRQLDLAVEYGQQVIWFPLAPDQPEVGRFFWLHNVLVTNRSASRVSLMPSLAIELNDGNHVVVDQKGVSIVPANFTGKDGLLHGPLDIEPGRSLRGDFGFTLLGAEERTLFGGDFDTLVKRIPPGLPVMYFVFRDLVTGEEVAHEVTHPKMMHSATPLSLRELQERKRAGLASMTKARR